MFRWLISVVGGGRRSTFYTIHFSFHFIVLTLCGLITTED